MKRRVAIICTRSRRAASPLASWHPFVAVLGSRRDARVLAEQLDTIADRYVELQQAARAAGMDRWDPLVDAYEASVRNAVERACGQSQTAMLSVWGDYFSARAVVPVADDPRRWASP